MMKSEGRKPVDLDKFRKQASAIRIVDASEKAPSERTESLGPTARRVAEQLRDDGLTPTMVIGQFRLFEFLWLVAVGLAVFYFGGVTEHGIVVQALAATGASAVAIVALQLSDCYQIRTLRTRIRLLPRVIAAWAAPFVLMLLSVYLFPAAGIFPLEIVVAWFLAGAAFLVVGRILFAFGIRNWARNGVMERRAVIVGGGDAARDLVRALESQPDNDIRVCGIFDDRGSHRSPVLVAGYPKLGTFSELVEFARLTRVDMLIIALPMSAEDRILELLKMLWVLPVDIRLAAHANKLRFRPRAYSHVGAVPMLDIFNKPIRDWDMVAKRGFDIAFSLLALALLWPVMLGAAIAVKATSKGPVFFKQDRHGFNNETIKIFKFRSMYTHLADPTARNAVTKNDPRVTPVGRFLRKSSIDELPQLFNVLIGSLSLVGPRPHALLAQTRDRAYSDVVEGYFARHRVRPGITGWAQINGWRGEIDNDDKIRFRTAFDLYYIENWSLLFDLKILFLTPFRLLNVENAY